jgi:hypothetical protein
MKNTLSFQAYSKSPYLSIKHSTYFEVYDELFIPYIGKDIIFVEIGVLDGGSLFMWRTFFGPQARIIGVDLNPDARKWEKYGFEIEIGNQSDKNFWKKFTEKFGEVDLILDDGGHTYEQQIITTEMLLSSVRDGGMLVVEDTHTSYMRGFGPSRYTFIKYVSHMIDGCNQRSSLLNPTFAEKRVWSVQSFESIVAFRINRKATIDKSYRTGNQGIRSGALDFRYQDNSILNVSQNYLTKFSFFKKFKILKYVYRVYLNSIISVGVSRRIKKYFRS